ncbi:MULTISPECIES: hypothetical protein [unclassified Paenibacillus]|uniref:hypothetical protein n=1 Tax=unclassified Paenibacillus TaxID=185978 RepID=UPI000B073076|nr:hypothetical protein [Paenibacillus sp. Soil750]
MDPAEKELMESRLVQLIKKYPGITPEMEAMFYIAYTRGFSDAWWGQQYNNQQVIH